jgi:hypothetical protein
VAKWQNPHPSPPPEYRERGHEEGIATKYGHALLPSGENFSLANQISEDIKANGLFLHFDLF